MSKGASGRSKTPWWQIARWLCALALLAVLFLTVDPQRLTETLGRIRLGWATAAALSTVALLLVGGLNVWLLLRRLIPLRLGLYMRIYLLSWAIGLVLPGQFGDASQIMILKQQGVQMAKSGAAYALDKGLSFLILCVIATVGAAHYVLEIPRQLLWIAPVCAVVVAAAGAWAVTREWRPDSPKLARAIDGLATLVGHFLSYRHTPSLVLANLAITIIKWGVLAFCYWAAFRAFGQPIPAFMAATLPVLSTLVGYVPVSVAGLGTVEWSAVYLFESQGLPRAEILAVYLFFRIFLYGLAGASVLCLRRPRAEACDPAQDGAAVKEEKNGDRS